jgi:excinuclease ABC subunit C
MSVDLTQTVKQLPLGPGVYRFKSARGEVLYVGKARSLRKRVASYFRPAGRALSPKIQSLVSHTAAIEVTLTHTEGEALLLENNLIKSLKPRYNVVLRDDKSYPYIFVSDTQEWPRLAFHRGPRREKGRYFGPYPSASAVRESLSLLQKVFPVRQCEDTFFRTRSRPCLQYQIKRCSAPCVGLVERERYLQDVRHAIMFLEGRSRVVIDEMMKRMEQAAAREEYETAALYRDRIAALKRIQERQYITAGKEADADVVAVATAGEVACVQVMFIRAGMNLGSKSYFPKMNRESGVEEVLGAFLPQHYLSGSGAAAQRIPERIYVSEAVPDREVLAEVLSEVAGRKVAIVTAPRGAPRRWLDRRGATPPRKCAARPPTGSGSRRASRRCARRSRSRRCRSASSASMSATPWARPRWPRAWCSIATGRSSRITAASISRASSPATTTARSRRR